MKALIQRYFLIPVLSLGAAFGAELTLYDFSKADEISRLSSEDVKYSISKNEFGPALRFETGSKSPWPSVYFKNEEGWDLSKYGEIEFPVKNLGKEPVLIYCRVDSLAPGQTDAAKALQRAFTLLVEAERSDTFHIPLMPMASAGKLKATDFFAMRGLPFFGSEGMHLEKIVKIIIFVYRPSRPYQFEVGKMVARGESLAAAIPEKPFPFVDAFGQFKHKDWPGKLNGKDDFAKRLAQESADLAAHPRPESWNEYGGWKEGPTLKATGFFRTEKYQGKWYLVDPKGSLFFSHGVDLVGYQDQTGLADRTHWFESLPPDDASHADFFGPPLWLSGSSYFNGKNTRTFTFQKYNVSLKYGADWKNKYVETTRKRLSSWGLNTMGNWSLPEFYTGGKIPYAATTYATGPGIAAFTGQGARFPDPFDPAFAVKSRERIQNELGPLAKDPWCMGVFVDNERAWGDETGLALAVLASPESLAAKKAFSEILKTKYGSVESLNTAWGTGYASWEALLSSTTPPAAEKARTDLTNFYAQLSDRYFKTVHDIVKDVAPNILYLGCRFAWTNPIATAAAGRYCDVVSFNIYSRSPNFQNKLMAEAGDKPIIIGEFHFGALDRGLFHGGLIPVKDQKERSEVYRSYVRDALVHPNLVGCHWFQYVDEPLVGRVGDGENYQIGFVDVTDTPYPELVAASREMGASLYKIRSGVK